MAYIKYFLLTYLLTYFKCGLFSVDGGIRHGRPSEQLLSSQTLLQKVGIINRVRCMLIKLNSRRRRLQQWPSPSQMETKIFTN